MATFFVILHYVLVVMGIIFSMMFGTLIISLFLNDGGKITISKRHPVYIIRYAIGFPFAALKAIGNIFNQRPASTWWDMKDNANRWATREASLCNLFWGNFIAFFFMMPISIIVFSVMTVVGVIVAPIAAVIAALYYCLRGTIWLFKTIVVGLYNFYESIGEKQMIAELDKFETKMRRLGPVDRCLGFINNIIVNHPQHLWSYRQNLQYVNVFIKNKHYAELTELIFERSESAMYGTWDEDGNRSPHIGFGRNKPFYRALRMEFSDSLLEKEKNLMIKIADSRTAFGKQFASEFSSILKELEKELIELEKDYAVRQEKLTDAYKLKQEKWKKRWETIVGFYKGYLCPTITYQQDDRKS